jgi:protocatechuate 3,4-dioxygenase beta subunit
MTQGHEDPMGGGGRMSGGGRGLTRRGALGLAGATGAGVLLAGPAGRLLGSGDGDEALGAAAKTCLRLNAEQEEGPFYVDLGKVRADVVDGQAGVPLDLRIRVIDHTRCVPVANAAVDIWQCNALGVYSDEESEGTVGAEYLRGIQFTDADGYAELRSVYPGHYQGRATHIHVKVHIGGTRTKKAYSGGHVSHTGQILFDEAMNTKVYARAPYNTSTVERTPNTADRVYTEQGGSKSMLRTKGGIGSGLEGRISLGIDPRATPAAVGV